MPEEREKGVERKEKMGCETNLVEEDLDGCEHEVGDNSEDVGSPEGGILDLYGRRVARKERRKGVSSARRFKPLCSPAWKIRVT